MPVPGSYRQDPVNALVNEVQKLRAEVNALKQAQFYMPIVDNDLDTQNPGNCWLFADGRLRVRLYDGTIKEFQAVVSPGGITSTVPKPTRPSAGTTHLKAWTAQWSQSYKNDGTQRADYPERLWVGNFLGSLGNNAALIGFDYTDIQTTLAGSLITGVKALYNSGYANTADGQIAIYWGTHSNTVAPTLWGGVVSYPAGSRWYGANEQAWTDLPNWVGEELRDGASVGLLVAGGDGSNVNGWGWGAATTLPPQLEITYVK